MATYGEHARLGEAPYGHNQRTGSGHGCVKHSGCSGMDEAVQFFDLLGNWRSRMGSGHDERVWASGQAMERIEQKKT